MTKLRLFSLFQVLLPLSAFSCPASLLAQTTQQTTRWQPSPGHSQVPIWPGTPPDSPRDARTVGETLLVNDGAKGRVAGRPWTEIHDVSQPTMTVYAPKGKNTGAAVVIFPGGGYGIVAIDLEGTEVCDWFTSRGITCILLKYRVLSTSV